jgi:hypothetical protein
MASIKTYALSIYQAQVAVAQKLGLDINHGTPEARITALSGAVILGVVLNRLETNGALTPAQLQQTINQVLAADFPVQPGPEPWNPESQTPAPAPDLGS